MTKAVSFLDKMMFGALLLLIIFTPYSSFMIQGALLLMLIAWFVRRSLIWKENPRQGFWTSYRFPSCGLDWPLIIIGLLIVATLPMSHAPALSLKKFFSRFLQQIFLMYVVIEIIRTPKRFYVVMATILLTLIVVNIDTLIQYLGGHSLIYHNKMIFGRVTGPMRHPNDFGSLLVTVLPLALSLLITRRFWIPFLFDRRWWPALSITCMVLLFALLVSLGLTASRGAWVAFTVTIIGFSIFLKNYRLLGITILGLALFFWIFSVNCINVRKDISKGVSSQEALFNSSSRTLYWQIAIDVTKRYPVFGCGYNAYVQTLKQLEVKHQEYPHNSILHIAAELGILGLAAHLWLFSLLLINGVKILKHISSQRDLYVLGVGLYFGIIAWLIHSLMDTPWESLLLNILWWLMVGLLLSLTAIYKQLNLSKGRA